MSEGGVRIRAARERAGRGRCNPRALVPENTPPRGERDAGIFTQDVIAGTREPQEGLKEILQTEESHSE